jgi:outer membrane protein
MRNLNIVILAFLLLGSGWLHADDFKVGVVDVERVLRESAPAMKAEKRIEKEFSGRDQEIKKLMQQAKDLQNALRNDGVSLSDVERRTKGRELTAMDVNLQRMQREFREDLNLRKNEELATVLEQANRSIQIVAEQENFDLILQEAVYRNPDIDITDKVIESLSGEQLNIQSERN